MSDLRTGDEVIDVVLRVLEVKAQLVVRTHASWCRQEVLKGDARCSCFQVSVGEVVMTTLQVLRDAGFLVLEAPK